jgi:hypothetical protein
MLDPIVNFFTRIFYWIGRAIGQVVAWLLWPFIWLAQWYRSKGWALKAIVGLVLAAIVAAYGYFFYATQFWTDFDPDYTRKYAFATNRSLAGDPVAGGDTQIAAEPQAGTDTNAPATADSTATGTQSAQAPAPRAGMCRPSDIVTVSADLVDFNVNQNPWLSSMLTSKAGFFGVPWKNTPYFDNKAAFQLGINQVMRRTTTELVDALGRVRGTSQVDQNLQDARTSLAYPEDAWYVSLQGPVRPTPSLYREAVVSLRTFNEELGRCEAAFNARADNLLEFLDRIANDIGSTSDILRARLEASNAGWFDTRADDRFWFAYGQLYAYYGILQATRSDFSSIVSERNLGAVWDRMTSQLRSALDMQPAMISNGHEASFIFPSHLATMGFYLLRVRSNLVEIRSVLDR